MISAKWKTGIGIAALVLMICLSFAARPGAAQAQGFGGGPQGKSMDRMDERFEMMAQTLHLNSSQQSLFEDMKTKTAAHMENKMQDRRRMMTEFKEEMLKEKPDMDGKARALKEEFRKGELAAYDEMIDSTTKFLKTLSPEQRVWYCEMRQNRRSDDSRSRPGMGRRR
jgi:Spy/CpxP family protein refolding chaperone